GIRSHFDAISSYFLVAAYAAGVSQREFEATDVASLMRDRIIPALNSPDNRATFEHIWVQLTGGTREFDIEGLRRAENATRDPVVDYIASDEFNNIGVIYAIEDRSTTRDVFNHD